jgi:hypothetical protein
MIVVPWSPNLPCPRGCKPWDDKGTFHKQSVIWSTTRKTGVATCECILCMCNFTYEFNPDIPFEHQEIYFRTAPDVRTLNGLVFKVTKKKGKGDTTASNDNG